MKNTWWWMPLLLAACGSRGGEPQLSLTVSSNRISGSHPIQVKAVATKADGTVGTGTVTFTSDVGSLAAASATLDAYGTASTALVCDPSTEPGCASDFVVATKWSVNGQVVTAQQKVSGDSAGPPCGVPLGQTVNATMYLTADDEGLFYLNGRLVATQAPPWSSNALHQTVAVNRNPTVPNIIAVEAHNLLDQTGVDRAVLVDFRLGDAGVANAPRIFASDDTWKVLLAPDGGDPSDGGWTNLGYDDSSWNPAVVELSYGDQPYGDIFSSFGIDSSGAKWIWAYDSATTPNRPVLETVYMRHVFYFTPQGGFSTTPGVCP